MSNLIKNTSYYTIGNILPRIAAFFLLPLYTRFLSTEEYGIVNSLQALTGVLVIFFTFSLSRSVFRLIYDYEKEQKEFLGSIAITMFFLATLMMGVLFLGSSLVGKIYKSIDFYPYYALAITGSYFSIFGNLPKVFLQVKEKAKTFVILSLIQFLVINIAITVYVVFLKRGAEGYLIGYLLAEVLMAIVFLIFTLKFIKITFNLNYIKVALSFSLPMIPANLSAWVMNLSNRIFIERFVDMASVGIFSLGYKIASLILIFSTAFKKAFDPYFYKLVNTSNDELETQNKIRELSTVFMVVVIFGGFIISFISKEIIVLLFPKEYNEAYKIIPIISLGYVASQMAAFYNLSFYQMKNTRIVMYISLISAAVNVLLNYLLINHFGVYGAAWASFFTFLVYIIIEINLSKRFYPIKMNLLFVALFTLVLSALYIFAELYFSSTNYLISLVVKGFIIISISFILYKKYFRIISQGIRSPKD